MECTEEGQPAAPDPDDTRFGERLKAIRKRRGLTQVCRLPSSPMRRSKLQPCPSKRDRICSRVDAAGWGSRTSSFYSLSVE